MLDIFSGLRLVIKRRNVSIDNAVFRCHWLFTSALLISFSLIITARQYVGQPIECYSVDKIPESLLNSYCWVQSTFSVPESCNDEVGNQVPYPCIDNTRGREVKMFAYYQWVGLVLFIQGLFFHLPYYLWKVWENGLIRAVTTGLRLPVMSDQERAKKIEVVVEYIQDHLGCHKRYAFKYYMCEIICLVNLLGQLWAVNRFFDGQFLQYGLDVIHYTSRMEGLGGASSFAKVKNQTTTTTRQQHHLVAGNHHKRQQPIDPMSFIFPRMTKCTYYDFGSSGDVQRHDALCLLPLNIIHEKIYIALWFWFLILTILTLLVIVYRQLAILSRDVRTKGLVSRCKLSSERDIKLICQHCDVGDWFLFYMVAENLDPIIMREIMAAIATKIQQQFQLKEELEMIRQKAETEACEAQELAKLKEKSLALERAQQESRFTQRNPLNQFLLQRQSSLAEDRSTPSSRRNSLAKSSQLGDDMNTDFAMARKLRKRLSTKRRLWSVDLGCSTELRDRLNSISGTSSSRANYSRPVLRHQLSHDESSTRMQVSAPPAHQMTLNSAPLSRLQAPQGANDEARGGGGGDGAGGGANNGHRAEQQQPDELIQVETHQQPAGDEQKRAIESSPTPSRASTAQLAGTTMARSVSSHLNGIINSSNCFVMDMEPITQQLDSQSEEKQQKQQQQQFARPAISHSHPYQHLQRHHQHSGSLGSRRELGLGRSDAIDNDSIL